ncbi:hypothetical protein GC194_15545 [bacterium]|nr:hypothetical protein [bacterium]
MFLVSANGSAVADFLKKSFTRFIFKMGAKVRRGKLTAIHFHIFSLRQMNKLLNKTLLWIERNPGIVVLCVVLVNLALRIIHTADSSIYLDEGQTMFQIKRPIPEIINDYVKRQQNAPFYFIFAHLWTKIVGLGVFKIRLLSVIFISLAGGMLYKLSARFFNPAIGIAASLLFLSNNIVMNFAHEARGYALIALLSISSFYFFLNLIFTTQRKFAYLLFATNLAIIFTHYLTIYLFLAQFIIALFALVLLKSKREFWIYLFSQIAVALLFLPWLRVVLEVMPEKGNFWIPTSSWPILKNVYYYLINGKLKTQIVFALLTLAQVVWLFQNKTNRDILLRLVLISWAFVPVLANFAVGFYIPVFLSKYTFYASFGFILLFAASFYSFLKIKYVYPLFIAWATVLSFISLNWQSPKAENWKDAVAYIKQLEKQDSCTIFIQNSYTYKAFYVYYDLDFFKESEYPMSEGEKFGVYFGEDIHHLQKLLPKISGKKLVLVRSHWTLGDPNADVLNYLNEHAELIKSTKEFKKVEVYEYLLNSTPDEAD